MANPPSWAEPSVPYPSHGVSLVVLQGIQEYSFLGTEHHPRAQRSPCGARGALPWESKINQSWHHQLMPPRAIGTAWCHTSKQLPLPTAGRHTAAAQCQCHHVPTRRQGGNLDYLVPSLGISSCSFLEVWQPQNCHHDPAWPSITTLLQLFPPKFSSSCYKCQELWAGRPGWHVHPLPGTSTATGERQEHPGAACLHLKGHAREKSAKYR